MSRPIYSSPRGAGPPSRELLEQPAAVFSRKPPVSSECEQDSSGGVDSSITRRPFTGSSAVSFIPLTTAGQIAQPASVAASSTSARRQAHSGSPATSTSSSSANGAGTGGKLLRVVGESTVGQGADTAWFTRSGISQPPVRIASKVDDIIFNSIRLPNGQLDSSPMPIDIAFDEATWAAFKADAAAVDNNSSSNGAGKGGLEALRRRIQSSIQVECLLWEGSQPVVSGGGDYRAQ